MSPPPILGLLPRSRLRRRPQRLCRDPPRAMPASGARPAKTDAPHLSQREREIIALLIGGRSVKEAAAALGLSPRTAETHLERLKRRFHQPRLLALVVHLVKRRMVE